MSAEPQPDDLLGPAEIAQLLGVRRRTVAQWVWRRRLPPPDLTRSGVNLWRRNTILEWADRTGRHHQEN